MDTRGGAADGSSDECDQAEPTLQPALGERLRQVRTSKQLSVAAVSDATGISRSFLSLVERGQSEITIGRLIKLVRYYGLHASDFIAELAGESNTIVRHSARRRIPSPEEKMDFYLLSPDDNRMTQPIIIDVQPGGALRNPGSHEGEEWLHILEGEILFELEGRDPTVLRVGDTAWFPGQHRHGLRNPSSDKLARVLSVTTPPNL